MTPRSSPTLVNEGDSLNLGSASEVGGRISVAAGVRRLMPAATRAAQPVAQTAQQRREDRRQARAAAQVPENGRREQDEEVLVDSLWELGHGVGSRATLTPGILSSRHPVHNPCSVTGA